MILGRLAFSRQPIIIPHPSLSTPPFDFSPHTNEIGAPKSLSLKESDGFEKRVDSLLFDGFP